MMEHLYNLINLINENDIQEDKIRDLACYILDNPEYMTNNLYRSVIFEVAQKLRIFGYIKGHSKITQDEFYFDNLSALKHETIQQFYKSKVYQNNLLDRRQKDVIDKFMSLEKKRIIVSAPTSFGKTFLLREIIFLNKERYKNILLLFPTIALLNENTDAINQFITNLKLDYKIINNVYSEIDLCQKYIFILTPERALKLLADNTNLTIDFFFFDEIYKIDEDFDYEEIDSVNSYNEKFNKGSRAKAFRIVLYLLAKKVKDYYLAGPYLNLESLQTGMKIFIKKNCITTIQINFEPTARIEIDAWKKNSIEHHPVLGKNKTVLYNHKNPNVSEKLQGIVTYLKNNNLGQAIFYCSTPAKTMKYIKDIEGNFAKKVKIANLNKFINHLKSKYNVKFVNSKNSSQYWSLITALENGVGVHHGKFPKYIQNEILRLFNEGDLEYLFCTSTIIEGVNTNAKNIVLINNSIGSDLLTAFALKNIKGRAGRYYHHAMGRVFYTDQKQRKIEKNSDMRLNFKTYDEKTISSVDIDNTDIDDLRGLNKYIKINREYEFDKQLLPDYVFIKNRLYDRDIQQTYLLYIKQDNIFQQFIKLINNCNNINFFLTNNVIDNILQSFVSVGILDEYKKKIYYAVISNYSTKGTMGILKYFFEKIQLLDSTVGEKVDSAYIKGFEQIRNIVEYEVPKLLSLFESLFKQAGVLLGYDMDNFNLSVIIRFFELGISTELGLFLVEFGFPIDTIRNLEKNYPKIGKISVIEAIKYFQDNVEIVENEMDEFEQELFQRAIKKLVTRI